MKKRISRGLKASEPVRLGSLGSCQTITEAERLILQEQYDAHSEKWQQGARGELTQDEIDRLQRFEDDIQNMLDSLEDLKIPHSSERP